MYRVSFAGFQSVPRAYATSQIAEGQLTAAGSLVAEMEPDGGCHSRTAGILLIDFKAVSWKELQTKGPLTHSLSLSICLFQTEELLFLAFLVLINHIVIWFLNSQRNMGKSFLWAFSLS